ncbi:hypothetical protein H5410_015014 [Solanum commersonii]|uniref:Uncharacterized protein n=1 Tax=Solanum commersonii TaxID=4109 RepID=A0A9J5ZSI8_SOLCO|nr:hypothetical protein H5410_015014 [Solanum commersonii]
MQGSIVHSKTQVVTHHYQRFSSSQYLLQMQVQAQQRYSNVLTERMIPYSHTMVQSLIAPESQSTLTLTKMNTMHDSTHRFTRIFQSTLFELTQDQKRLFKSCNRAESKGMVI